MGMGADSSPEDARLRAISRLRAALAFAAVWVVILAVGSDLGEALQEWAPVAWMYWLYWYGTPVISLVLFGAAVPSTIAWMRLRNLGSQRS